jgi:glycosyltransferase involved in cell wall biosynthesis
MKTSFDLSVVLSTRNRSASLARLLDGLAGQIGAPPFEVIIGDNGCNDDTADVIERAQTRLTIRSVREERLGKSRALNAALKLARGELIVFTDDDVLPQSDWLAQLHVAALRQTDANIFGGRIEVNTKAVPGWILKSFNLMGPLTSAHDNGPSFVPYDYGTYPFGPNMAIRRNLLKGISSPFPVHIGPGTSQPVGDESFFFVQFSPPHADDRLFVPSASVFHEIQPKNVVFISALKRCFLLGRCHAWLALPPVARRREERESIPKLMADRLKTCQSIRELCCLSARFIGYRWGRRELRTGRLPGMVSAS